MHNKLLDSKPDIARNAAQQYRRQIAASVHRYRGCAAVAMLKALVRAPLSDFLETERG